ncbi:uncharacterized protein ZHAS_00008643 [Anopheles sinensis]|uniref:Uncharacterized protein n=1 Tax=Anopheles sinensis TaxID=74873 RepID=A0A084VST2_ANOSI|nr:uncharacterized protein ZHAS_00008643 [Anopheles sinensis]
MALGSGCHGMRLAVVGGEESCKSVLHTEQSSAVFVVFSTKTFRADACFAIKKSHSHPWVCGTHHYQQSPREILLPLGAMEPRGQMVVRSATLNGKE